MTSKCLPMPVASSLKSGIDDFIIRKGIVRGNNYSYLYQNICVCVYNDASFTIWKLACFPTLHVICPFFSGQSPDKVRTESGWIPDKIRRKAELKKRRKEVNSFAHLRARLSGEGWVFFGFTLKY